jgi:hypothetical protein
MFEWEYHTHEFKDMVGAIKANFSAPLWKRYVHFGSHRRRPSMLQVMVALFV